MAPRWEYRVEVVGSFWRGARPDEIQDYLTEAAEDDWELVEVVPLQNTSRLMLFLRRSLKAGGRSTRKRVWP